jgi:hypothetical protein
MVRASGRWFVLAVLFSLVGCQTYTRVTQKEFRTIVFNTSSTEEAVLVESDDEYDYYHVGDKRYKVPHRYAER